MTNIEKAIALINTFATGDEGHASLLITEGYIQHNLAYGTGRDAFVGAVKYLGSAPVKTTVRTIRSFEDGDRVFLHNVYNFAGSGEQAAFDIFRFEEGLIAEHWDNLAVLAAANPSGHTQIDGAASVEDQDKTEENKKLVAGFVGDVLRGENPGALLSYFDGDNYIQHNTGIADGISGLGAALAGLAEAGIQMIYNKTHQILGNGNFALAVSEGTFGDAPTSYYDLFRVENGKIAEHWDVMETIIPESDRANSNGKF
jgi:predicted SnoaL-like aldol condensation-catalyzing enzyme